MHSLWKSLFIGLLVGLGLAGMAATHAGAQNAVGVISGTPLKIQIFPNNGLQVWHNRYTQARHFWDGRQRLYHCPEHKHLRSLNGGHGICSQDPTAGQGTSADPFRSVLRQRLTSGGATLELTQTALYVNNSPSFQLEWLIANTGQTNACFNAYHFADIYFANDDRGIGYYNAAHRLCRRL